MYISPARQSYAAMTDQSGSMLPKSQVVVGGEQAVRSTSPSRTVDMRNVSLNEINELIKSGVDGLLDFVPCIPLQHSGERGAEYAANIKFDYLSQIQGAIDYQRSIGENSEFLESVLDTIKRIDGMNMPERIHVVA